MISNRWGIALVLGVLAGCSSSSESPGTPEPTDAGDDTTAADTARIDTSVTPDTNVEDTNVPAETSAETSTETSVDSATTETTVADTAVADTAVVDSAVVDSTVVDSTVTDTAVVDTAVSDTATTDASVPAPAATCALHPFPFEDNAALRTDATGNVIVAGNSKTGWTAPGGSTTPLTGFGEKDVWVAKFTDTCTHVWSKQFGGTVDDGMANLAVVPGSGAQAGNVIVNGRFTSTVDLGGGNVTGFVIFARSAATGAHVWSKQTIAALPPALYPSSIAADANGNVFATFGGKGTADLGAPVGSITTTGNDVLIAKYSNAGALLWAKHFVNAGDQLATAVAVDASGNVFITGSNKGGTLDLGGGKSTTGGVFIAKFDTDGNALWLKGFGASTDSGGIDLVVNSSGDVIVITAFSGGTIDFGGGALTGKGLAIVKFKGSDGSHLWSKQAPATSPRLGIDAAGDLLITGSFGAAIDFGGATLPAPASGDTNMYLVKFAGGNGAHVWSRAIGTAKVEVGYGIGGGASNAVWATGRGGNFGVTDIDLGGTLKASGPAFLVKYPAK